MIERSMSVPGLAARAEIRIDRWGIPHIRANSRHDLFLAQGFNAARDRLWQIDLWRKRGLGQLAADHGPGFLAQDRACRLFLYRGDMAAEWAAYGAEATETITAFVTGINAYVSLALGDATFLPPEFPRLGVQPAMWQAEDVVRIRSHALAYNLASEVARARVLAAGGDAALDGLRRTLTPPRTPIAIPGADDALPPDLLDTYLLARADAGISPERRAATIAEAWRWSKLGATGQVAPAEGSNAWVVAGSRTATGRPILANDPHRAFGHPSLRYLAHLTAPDLDVIGAGEPAMPGVAIGHNDRLAFGLTIFPADQEDLMVYETHPEDPGRYRYGDGWEAMRTVLESVPVRGEPDQEILLKFTRHGPVIHEDPARRRAYAVRTVWLEPGASAYLGSLRYLDAASHEEFAAALAHWVAPPVNQLCAETGGRIGWIAAAAVPNRPNWDGLTPVPGNGSHEWNGFLRGEALPRRYDPPDGFIVTANEMNLPPDHPTERQVGFEWMDRFRADRLNAVLGGDRALSVDAARRLQSDHLSAPAVRVVALLAASRIDSGLLAGWDGRIERYSAAAALFEIWWSRHLKPAVLARMAPEPRLAALLAPGDDTATLAVLEHPTPRWSAAERDSLLTATLAAAMAECAARMGPDPAGWSWGLVHRLVFAHSAGRDGDVGPVPLGGSAATVGLGDYRPADLAVLYGASFRMVLDVGEWDRSLAINAPGQSGNPASPHYADLVPLWAEGECVPLLYSTAAVDTATEERILLLP